MNGFECLDCGVDTSENEEYYMLKDWLWLLVHPSRKGKLCLSCVETRLGRRLVPNDFSDAPINELQAEVCPALKERLAK